MSDFRFTRPSAFPPVIKNLIIINVLVFVAQMMFDKQFNLTSFLELWPVQADEFKPYQVFTHMFAHSTTIIFHIIFNMFALWMFGRVLENVWGAKRFLFFYLACGIGAAIIHMTVSYFQFESFMDSVNLAAEDGFTEEEFNSLRSPVGPTVGASGAVMGVMVAFAFLFPNTELYMMFIPIPIKAKWAITALVALDLFGGITPTGDNIAHFAHLGGALTGFIIVWIWNKTNRRTMY